MLAPGTQLGPYQIAEPIGAGGMGDVYRARDTRLHRDVAIKVVKEASSEQTGMSRLRREAQAVAALSHPAVCAIFDVGDHNGRPYLVMELLKGETLQARLTRGSLPLPEALDRAIALADGLEAGPRKGAHSSRYQAREYFSHQTR